MPRTLPITLTLALLAGCGTGSSLAFKETPTPSPTITPTPVNVYELTEQSRVRLGNGPEEPATGQLAVSPCFSPNTHYAYHINSLTITSESVLISGSNGEFETVTFAPGLSFSAPVVVNGVSRLLTGHAPPDDPTTGETLTVDLTAGPLTVHLEAQRTGPPYGGAGYAYPPCFG